MATKIFFRNQKTGRRYLVVRIDKDKNEIVLKGEYAEFVEPYDKERFKKLGYTLEREE